MPERIQMSRQRPWRAQNPDAVIVARPTKWGNPWKVGDPDPLAPWRILTRADAVEWFQRDLMREAIELSVAEIRAELGGHDLACWCPLDKPCHADVLLELANQD